MRRRDFVKVILGSAAGWPLAVRAQQGERVRRVAVLSSAGSIDTSDPETQANVTAFVEALQHLGWASGRNLRIDHRVGGNNVERIRKLAEELVALAPDVILTAGATSVAPLLQATRSTPVVFVNVADPVGAGYAESLARPGRNATGFMSLGTI